MMAIVEKIGEDMYTVQDFLQSMSSVKCRVHFMQGNAHVTDREGTTSREWDRHAIGAVQSAIVAETVVDKFT